MSLGSQKLFFRLLLNYFFFKNNNDIDDNFTHSMRQTASILGFLLFLIWTLLVAVMWFLMSIYFELTVLYSCKQLFDLYTSPNNCLYFIQSSSKIYFNNIFVNWRRQITKLYGRKKSESKNQNSFHFFCFNLTKNHCVTLWERYACGKT